ncbi:MAG: tetratricopeptide repeat protein, partial [Bacteriovoracia bacterium]
TFVVFAYVVLGTNFVESLKQRSQVVNNYETKALQLAKSNRDLQAAINQLRYKIQTLETENQFLDIKLSKYEKPQTASRGIASVKPTPDDHVVKYEIYKWSPKQMLMLADSEFKKENYSKSAHYFNSLIERFHGDSLIDDKVFYQAGLAAYQSQKYYDWAISHFNKLMKKHPTSKFYRQAKLWHALSLLKKGKAREFYKTVEEFRLRYRNTDEWKILSGHYEELRKKFKPEQV